jgi:nucleoside phosphorylase
MSEREVVVLAAMARELRPLARTLGMRASPLGGLPAWRSHGVVAAAVGVGPQRAGAGTAQVLDQVEARRVLVTGVAGALDPALEVGDLVRPHTVVDVRTASTLVARRSDLQRSDLQRSDLARAGILATVDRAFVLGGEMPAGAATPALPHGATAVDMESAAIAAVAEARGIAWDVIRAVSDVAGTLTPEVAALLSPEGRVRLLAAARLVLGRPQSARRLLRLGVDTNRALRAATGAIVRELAADGIHP